MIALAGGLRLSASTGSARTTSSPPTWSSTCCSATSPRCCCCSALARDHAAGHPPPSGGRACAGPLAHPLTGIVLWLGLMYLWHIPALYDAARGAPARSTLLEHVSFFTAGVALWWPLIQPVPMRRRLTGMQPLAYIASAKAGLAALGLCSPGRPPRLPLLRAHAAHLGAIARRRSERGRRDHDGGAVAHAGGRVRVRCSCGCWPTRRRRSAGASDWRSGRGRCRSGARPTDARAALLPHAISPLGGRRPRPSRGPSTRTRPRTVTSAPKVTSPSTSSRSQPIREGAPTGSAAPCPAAA